MSYGYSKFKFKNEHKFDERVGESTRVLTKYPDRVPIICQKSNVKGTPDIDKNKFLAPKDLSIAQFMYAIKQRMNVNSSESIFLFNNGQILSGSTIIGDIYATNKDPDGFIYLEYSKENVFG